MVKAKGQRGTWDSGQGASLTSLKLPVFQQESLPLSSKRDNEESHMEREQDPDIINRVMNYIRQ